ncbi:hypothetical protein RR46_01805 [Papilio xuthus]|uniref:DUF5641 domain-containing protein n=1 Tax=Papilio xuthus TaxID=66420 RepID=A0A194QH82_PAPXU|nr:hypothetical protein RR46_01805 [Papilio xuthus]
MDLKKLTRERCQFRRIFNRHAAKEKFTDADIEFLETKFKAIISLDQRIQEILLEDVNYDEETITNEFNDCQEIEKRWLEIKCNGAGSSKQGCTQIPLNLPKIEMRKFDDNPKSWIAFWTQYEKIHLGDIVIIQAESSHRLHWPIGIIKETFTGRDGCTRTARVKTASGEKVRPYQRLFPLEVSAVSQEWLNNVPIHKGPSDTGNVTSDASINDNPPSGITTRSGRTIMPPIRF